MGLPAVTKDRAAVWRGPHGQTHGLWHQDAASMPYAQKLQSKDLSPFSSDLPTPWLFTGQPQKENF